MRCEVRPVSGRRELKKFILYPWRIYRGPNGYSNWAPPLIIDQKTLFNPKKHPFFQHAEEQNYSAFRDGDIVGRISGIVDHQFIQNRGEKTAYFGFYESIDDEEVAGELFHAVEFWARERGIDAIFVYETYVRSEKYGLDWAEVSLILEDNDKLVHMLDKWGAERYRTYRVFEKAL